MWEAIKSISSLFLSFGLLLLGSGMTGTLLGLRARHEGFPTEITGIIMAGYFFGLLLGGPVCRSRRRDRRSYPSFCRLCVNHVDGRISPCADH